MTTNTNKKVYRLKNSNESFEVNNNLLNEFENMESRNGTQLSPYSCKSYASKVNRISILMTNKPYEDYKYFVNNVDNIIKKVNDSELKSKKDYFSAINKLLKSKNVNETILDKYKQAMKITKEQEDKTRGENMATDSNVKKSQTAGNDLEDIQNKIKKYSIMENNKIDDIKLINKLLVSFYFMNNQHFIPRNDLPEFKLISISKSKKPLPDEFNYIVINPDKKPMKIIMKNYKTKSKYGTQSFKISQYLEDILQTYLKEYGKTPGDYLFVDKNNKPFKHSNFSNLLNNSMEAVLGAKIGIDLARQIVLSNLYNDNLMTINERHDLARAFLHSPDVAQEYIRVNLINKKENNKNI
jgi:hypothetical protein